MQKPVIMLAEHDEDQRRHLHAFLLRQGFDVLTASDAHGVLRAVRQRRHVDLLLINAALETARDGMEVVHLLHQGRYGLPVILLAPQSSEELAIAALRAGVRDYLPPPLSYDAVLTSIRRCLADGEPAHPRRLDSHACVPISFIGDSPQMQVLKTFRSPMVKSEKLNSMRVYGPLLEESLYPVVNRLGRGLAKLGYAVVPLSTRPTITASA